MTQAMWEPPLRSPTIVGSAVDDDRLVEGGQQHAEHQRADDDQDAPVAEAGQGAVGGRLGAADGRGSGGGHQRLSFLSATSAVGTRGRSPARRDVIPRDLAQGAMLGQPVGERPEGQVDELVERYRSA